jgi:2-polyprenyl-6-methoxyphenol hydroxylase-like FAD-dependent oxidoreductase
VEGWDAQVHAIIRASTSIINWKLVMHDPLPTWLSPKRRIALLGDAAHPFLPSSQQGASQAVEDGVTLAVCLLKAGREKIPEALSIYEKMRYDRVRQAQTTGVTARDRWHEADYSRVHENPESIKMVLEGWILNHDSEEQANATYNEVLASLH